MRSVTAQQRRDLMVRRHHLGGGASSPEAVTGAVVALHATDPASVYLSVLARSATSTLGDVAAAMYERRSLVRWMGMRRTLFVVRNEDVPMVQAAAGKPVAAVLRRRLISQIHRFGADPDIEGSVDRWLMDLEDQVATAVSGAGAATGAELARRVPGLATSIKAAAGSAGAQRVTTSLLTLMAAEGRIVRGLPTGAWTSRQHRWEPVTARWPAGIPVLDVEKAQRALAGRWLARFGPATVEDLQWWTGWTKTTTRRVLAELPVQEIDLHGRSGLMLPDPELDEDAGLPVDEPALVATLLPALDPTPMGWKQRDWFLAVDAAAIFDRAGNIGPTVWWGGHVIGTWAVTSSGQVRTVITADRGEDAQHAVEQAAAQLTHRLDGAVVTPAARTPLEQSLTR